MEQVNDQSESLVYVLLLHQSTYNPISQKLSEPNPLQILDKIACEKNTPTAHVDYEEVEALTNTAITSWCYKHQTSPDEVERICPLYLKPEKEKITSKLK